MVEGYPVEGRIAQPILRHLLVVLGLWLLYTLIQSALLAGWIDGPAEIPLSFLPGLLAIGYLRLAGLTRSDSFLQFGSISGRGLVLYVVLLVFYWLVVIPTGTFTGWDWAEALVYAPVGAITQELFFRASLFPILLLVTKGRLWLSLLIHSFLFGLWHIGTIFAGAPLISAIFVMLVPFFFGLGWGWQVWRDKTLLWSILHHTLLLVIMSFYTWG